MSRTYTFIFTVECVGDGTPDLVAAENMIDLTLQELLMGDDLIKALDEKEAVTIQVNLVK
jgi:hypothetical protein